MAIMILITHMHLKFSDFAFLVSRNRIKSMIKQKKESTLSSFKRREFQLNDLLITL